MGLRTSTFEFFFPGAAVRRALKKPERLSAGSFPAGHIGKIVGQMTPSNAGEIESPITHTACVAYHLRITMTAAEDLGWYPVVSTSVGVPFSVEDDSGSAKVFPERAEMDLNNHFDSRAGYSTDQLPALEALLRIHGVGFTGWIEPGDLKMSDSRGHPRSIRVQIGLLEVGKLAAVAGRGLAEPVLDAKRQVSYRAGPATELVFRQHRRTPLYISDRGRSTRE